MELDTRFKTRGGLVDPSPAEQELNAALRLARRVAETVLSQL